MTSPPPKEPRQRTLWFLGNVHRFLYGDVSRLIPMSDPMSVEIRAMVQRWMSELATLIKRWS